MNKILCTVLLALLGCSAARADFSKPDFAYPATVITDAESVLRTSTGLDRFCAAMQIVKAKITVNPDSALTMPTFISQIAAIEKATDVRGLLLLYEADIISDYYNRVKWQIRNRETPEGPLPADMSEWSATQFDSRLSELSDSALVLLKPYFSRPLRNYSSVIAIPAESAAFYNDLASFAYRQAISVNPSEASHLRAEAVAQCSAGSPQWAMWICENNIDKTELLKLYNLYPQGLTGAYILYKAVDKYQIPAYLWDNEPAAAKQNLDMLRSYLENNGQNSLTPTLQSMVKAYTAPRATVRHPDCVSPDNDIRIIVDYGFMPEVTVAVYKIDTPWIKIVNMKQNRVFYKKMKLDESASIASDTLTLRLPAGNYYVRADMNGNTSMLSSFNLTVTPYLPVVSSADAGKLVTLTDYKTGAPVAGTSISAITVNGGSTRLLGKTDSDGFIEAVLPVRRNYTNYYLNVKDHTGHSILFDNMLSSNGSIRQHDDNSYVNGAIFVDRPAYHPGDTVSWSVIAVGHFPDTKSSQLLTGKSVNIKFYDANYQEISSGDFTTDEYGRASGRFAIPQDLLTGRFHISMTYNKRNIADASLMVSDFTPPVFELKDISIERTGNTYHIAGEAVRYSGAPEPDARVSANIRTNYYYPFRSTTSKDIDITLHGDTDAEGKFNIEFPADTIDNGNYECVITVTNTAADEATATARFRAGKPYYIWSGYNADRTVNVDEPVKLPVTAYNSHFEPSKVEGYWELRSSDSASTVLYSDTVSIAKDIKLDWNKIPAGEYRLHIVPVDTTLFDSTYICNVKLYSIRNNQIPSAIPFIIPDTDLSYEPGATSVPVNVGVHEAGHVFFVAFRKDGKSYKHMYECRAGFNTLQLPVVSDLDTKVDVFFVKNGKAYTESLTLTEKKPSRKLTLKGEAWRDYVTPGTSESWTLRLSDAEGNPIKGAMVATMYNHAIDALASLSWPDNLQSVFATQAFNNYIYTVSESNSFRNFSLTRPVHFNHFAVDKPDFLYRAGSSGIRIRGYHTMKMAASSRSGAPEAVAEDAVIVSNDAFTGSVAGVQNLSAIVDMGAPEMAVEEESITADTDAGTGNNSETFDFRESETLQAFWMPELLIGDDGIASIRFNTPNAIGAWNFRAAAWTVDCRTAEMSATLTASKPVMVQPNLPRFLRQGDEARILSTVINNSDSVLNVTTKVEIFNPADDSIIATDTFRNTIQPRGQAIVPINAVGPVGLSSIGYRVRSSANGFTDGEQSLIPVLEASTVAIDSEIFYLTDADSVFTTTIPAATDCNGTIALQYCQNPVWDVVKTLPGLYEQKPRSATSAAASAYAAYTARGLYDSFQEIRQVLDIWHSQPADSALISKLYKNEDIKLALLAQTPFVGSANADTEQMERLAITFDKKIIDRTASAAVTKLESLQNPDGGFAWGDWMRQSSDWITECVLTSIGRLSLLGFYPTDNSRLNRIVDRAFAYLDSHVDKNGTGYAYLYSLYPGRKPSTLQSRQIVDRTIQQAIASWKKYSTTDKARAAIMLHNMGNRAVAAEIMRSVAQFAVPDGKQGTSFPSVNNVDSYSTLLEAFGTIAPQSEVIDGMKQWLVLRTQANDDLGAWNPLNVAAAFLATGSRWTAIPYPGTANVAVDGKSLDIDKTEAITGTYSLRLPTVTADRSVTFTRPAGAPVSYGSIVSIATRPLDKVKAAGSKHLSVDKRCLVQRNGKWIQTDDFILGERVQIQIIIKADRDMQYITVRDDRPAAFEPVDQMPGWVSSGDLRAYRENADTRTNLFVNYLPKGTYYLTYEMTAALAGTFASGTATVQSQYAPEFTARSSASRITVNVQ